MVTTRLTPSRCGAMGERLRRWVLATCVVRVAQLVVEGVHRRDDGLTVIRVHGLSLMHHTLHLLAPEAHLILPAGRLSVVTQVNGLPTQLGAAS